MTETTRPEDTTPRAPGTDRDEAADELRSEVRRRYGTLARGVLDKEQSSCCGPPTSCCGPATNPITSELYTSGQAESIPEDAVVGSLGCGNPTALAELREGDVVLDLGSGGGIDVLLSARRVGPTGKAYGLDMTDDMLELARKNQAEAGVENVEFLKGHIEEIPLPDASVDVIISNCVINLSADKGRVFREAFRVLRPGGLLAVSDIVVRGEIDSDIRHDIEAWIGCVAGALEEDEYRSGLRDAGFDPVEIEPTRVFTAEDARELLAIADVDAERVRSADGRVLSAFVRARRPEPSRSTPT